MRSTVSILYELPPGRGAGATLFTNATTLRIYGVRPISNFPHEFNTLISGTWHVVPRSESVDGGGMGGGWSVAKCQCRHWGSRSAEATKLTSARYGFRI